MMGADKKLLRPRMPYLWEYLIGRTAPKPMAKAKRELDRFLSAIGPTTKVRIYIRIEKE